MSGVMSCPCGRDVHSWASGCVPLLRQSCTALLFGARQHIHRRCVAELILFMAIFPASRQALCCPHWVSISQGHAT